MNTPSPWMRAAAGLAAALAAGLLGGWVAGTAWGPAGDVARPLRVTAVTEPPAAGTVAALEARLAAVERRLVAPPEPGRAAGRPTAGAGASAPELARLAARVAALERALAELSTTPADGAPVFGPPGSQEALLAELESLGTPRDRYHPPARERRIALREELLERFPDAPDAGEHLVALGGDLVGAGRADEAQAVLERHRGRVALEPWRFDRALANALVRGGRGDEGRQAYWRVVADLSAPADERASAQFFHAYALRQEGRTAEARAAFEALLADWEAAGPEVSSSVQGARAQLEKLAD